MPRTLRSVALFSLAISCILASCLSPLWAKEKPVPEYPMSGKVLASSAKGAHSYQIATDSKLYLMMCERVGGFHWGMAECKVNDKPIAIGDKIQFRIDGDKAFVPDLKGEQELRVLTTEFKVIPPVTPLSADESSKDTKGERAQVIGTGMHIAGQKMVGWSTTPSAFNRPSFGGGAMGMAMPGMAMATASAPVMASGPVLATPVTGGAPVMMMPTGPVGGGMVMGVPLSGGAPVMGIPTAPVMGVPFGGAPMGAAHAGPAMGGGGPPPWVHILRVRAGESIYVLECSTKPCEADKKPIELGDTLRIRAEKKWAFISTEANSGGKEAKFRILNETEDEPASDTQ